MSNFFMFLLYALSENRLPEAVVEEAYSGEAMARVTTRTSIVPGSTSDLYANCSELQES